MQKTIVLFSLFLSLSLFGAAADAIFEQNVKLFERAVVARNTQEILDQHEALREKDKAKAYEVAQSSSAFIDMIYQQPDIPAVLSPFAQCFAPTSDIYGALKTCDFSLLQRMRATRAATSKRVTVSDALAMITADSGNLVEAFKSKNMPLVRFLLSQIPKFQNDPECLICFDATAKQTTTCCFSEAYCVGCITTWIARAGSCPICPETLQAKMLFTLPGATLSTSSDQADDMEDDDDDDDSDKIIPSSFASSSAAASSSSASAASCAAVLGEYETTARMYQILGKARDSDLTPLMLAAKEGNANVIRMLLDQRDDDVNVVDKNGWTALMHAAWYGDAARVRALLDAGVDVNAVNKNGSTALMYAAWHGDVARVRALLDAGDDVNAVNKNGWTALMHAAYSGDVARVRALLGAGAEVNAADKNGWTALMCAAWYGDAARVRALLDAGAEVNAVGGSGDTVLMCAAWHGDVDGVRALLDAGADVNAVNWLGYTALMRATKYGDAARVRALLDAGADVNAVSKNGWTALMCAACYGDAAMVQALLDAGADVNAVNGFGCTALSLAKGYNKTVVPLLKDAGETAKEESCVIM